MTSYTIDLCVDWVRVGECPTGTFDGIIRNVDAGEWRLAGYTEDLDLEADVTIADVNTVRVVRDKTIVFAGFVLPVTDGVGGLERTDTAEGEAFVLSGPDLWSVLASRVAYPTPSTDAPWADTHDERVGLASTAAAGYIEANAGITAIAARQIPGLVVIDGTTGITGQWSARLQPLDQLVARVCRDGGIVCRLGIAHSGAITATIGSPRDRRSTCVLSDEGDLIGVKKRNTAAKATYVIAGGQGQLTSRVFETAGTASGAARREQFVDQTSLATASEVLQAATTTRAFAGVTMSIQAELVDSASQRITYLVDYDVGDTVAVELDSVRYPAPVDAVSFHLEPSRKIIRPILGDAAPNLVVGLVRDVANLQSRFDTQIA